MQQFPINWGALSAAAVVKWILGFLWYSPVAFLRPWQNAAGLTDDRMKQGMVKGMVVHLIGCFVMAFVLVHAVHYAGAKGPAQGAAVGFFNWLGFVLVVQLDDVFAAKRPARLLWINSGYLFVALLIMGAILAAWT